MNTVDIINRISEANKISTGRAEMIISIIVEKITDKLRKDDEANIVNFGTFSLLKKKTAAAGFGNTEGPVRNYVRFIPEKPFLDIINS
jgi:nucleoid DNA-binding protein